MMSSGQRPRTYQKELKDIVAVTWRINMQWINGSVVGLRRCALLRCDSLDQTLVELLATPSWMGFSLCNRHRPASASHRSASASAARHYQAPAIQTSPCRYQRVHSGETPQPTWSDYRCREMLEQHISTTHLLADAEAALDKRSSLMALSVLWQSCLFRRECHDVASSIDSNH